MRQMAYYRGSRTQYDDWVHSSIYHPMSRIGCADKVRHIRKNSSGAEARHFLAHLVYLGSKPTGGAKSVNRYRASGFVVFYREPHGDYLAADHLSKDKKAGTITVMAARAEGDATSVEASSISLKYLATCQPVRSGAVPAEWRHPLERIRC